MPLLDWEMPPSTVREKPLGTLNTPAFWSTAISAADNDDMDDDVSGVLDSGEGRRSSLRRNVASPARVRAPWASTYFLLVSFQTDVHVIGRRTLLREEGEYTYFYFFM